MLSHRVPSSSRDGLLVVESQDNHDIDNNTDENEDALSSWSLDYEDQENEQLTTICNCDQEENDYSLAEHVTTTAAPLLSSSHENLGRKLDSVETDLNNQHLNDPPTPVTAVPINRNSSCYFSVASSDRGSLCDLLSLLDQQEASVTAMYEKDESTCSNSSRLQNKQTLVDGNVQNDTIEQNDSTASPPNTATSLYHDVLMNIFTFLDLDSLASFSETCKRANGECYYFLHLQLQSVLRIKQDDCRSDSNSKRAYLTANLQNFHLIERLACLDIQAAKEAIQTLYIDASRSKRNRNAQSKYQAAKMVAAASSAAALVVFMGMVAAHQQGGSSQDFFPDEYDEFASALTSFFKFMGVVGGLAAAKTMTNPTEKSTSTNAGISSSRMTEIQSLLWARFLDNVIPSSINRKERDLTDPSSNEYSGTSSFTRQLKYALHMAYSMATERLNPSVAKSQLKKNEEDNDSISGKHSSITSLLEDFPLLISQHYYPDPYENISTASLQKADADECDESNQPNSEQLKCETSKATKNFAKDTSTTSNKSISFHDNKYYASGCVGAYQQVVHSVRDKIKAIVKQKRLDAFNSLAELNQQALAVSFMDAVIADDRTRVESMIHTIDIDRAYSIGDNNPNFDNNVATTMFPLHAAAFHNADKVLQFLCDDIDSSIPCTGTSRRTVEHCNAEIVYADGGLVANVNQQDPTGWTALHFAAGANSVSAVRILLASKADPSIEADNGYSPFQWSTRLQHHLVEEEFKRFFAQQQQEQLKKIRSTYSYYRGTW